MADPIDITNMDPTKLTVLTKAAELFGISVQDLVAKLKGGKEALVDFMALGAETGKVFDGLGGKLGVAGNKAIEFGKDILTGSVDALKTFGLEAALFSTNVGRNLINPIAGFSGVINALPAGLQHVNNAFKGLVSAQTEARTAAIMLGAGLDSADAAASVYPQTLRRMSAMLSMSTTDLHGMTQAVRIIPGALTEASGKLLNIGSIATATIQPTAILATTMRAFGMDAKASATMARDAWLNFNQTIPETLKQVGFMAAASKATGVDMGTAHSQIEAASKSIAIFGQGSAAAANIWTTFMTSLRGSGVPISEIDKMVGALTSRFGNMVLSTKAFISTMSGMGGGRSAIGGAIQMEMNMRTPGGMEKNMEMLTRSLGQITGGKIITLEQAASNPQLEAQFIVQRGMLEKLTGIGNPEQQNRMLEVMKNVQSGGVSQLEGGKALNDAFKSGKDIQAQSLTFLEAIANNTQMMLGGTTDKKMEAVQKTLIQGNLTGERRENGMVGGLQQMGWAGGFQASEDRGGARYSMLGAAGMENAFRELRRNLGSLGTALKEPKEIAPEGGSGTQLDRIRKALAGDTGSIVGAVGTMPATEPTHRILGTLQQKDDEKLQKLDRLIEILQQQKTQAPATETKKLLEPEVGSNSVLTIKIMSDEDKVIDLVRQTLEKYSNVPLGYPGR